LAGDTIVVSNVSKRFGATTALDGASLGVDEGEIYGLLGPNGSGKSTLIRMLVGLIAPDSGEVRVLGHRMPDTGVLSSIGYMTQQAALYPDLSVAENVGFFAEIESAGADRVEEALRLVDMWARRDSLVGNLSGGMRTRCSLACALVHDPRVLLLDEPTVGVDPQLRQQFWEHFRAIAAAGVTILVSSHVMDEAERCDRLGLIRGGRLLADGTAASLRKQAGTKTLEEAFLALSKEGPA